MKLNKIGILALVIGISTISGCSTYRTSSNIQSQPASVIDKTSRVIISEGDIKDQEYEEIGPIEVSVKKLTVFHKDPTKEQANEALIEKARMIGANAVVNVSYKSGIGLTTWGYMDAKGTGVKVVE
ncbi:MAG: heavy metal-binding domain-containing protein [Planococcaceae bacterium]|nr:heavy metal-binding domain-containing protein [Planococcaceae bacterium]